MKDYTISTSAPSWTAYKVYKLNYCDPDELIGYYQTESGAELAKLAYIERENKRCGRFEGSGICCNNKRDIYIDKIIIEP